MPKNFLTPPEICQAMIETGIYKAKNTALKQLLLGLLGGLFIAFGAQANITVLYSIDPGLAKLVGAAVFPVGLMLVILAGAELFTGNNLISLALLDDKISLNKLLKNWGIVYFANFAGAMLFAFAIVKTNILIPKGLKYVFSMADIKLQLSFSEAFIEEFAATF